MRTKEIEKIRHLYGHTGNLCEATKRVEKTFPFYRSFLKELRDKSETLYHLYVNESSDTRVATTIKKIAKAKTIRHVLKLTRGVVLHAILTNNKSLQRASEYTYSDFNRPSEDIRAARFNQIVNAAKRLKHPEQFGLTRKIVEETENLVKEYCKTSISPALRKKERARQAKQCRKMLNEINFLLRKKMAPLMENIAEEFPNEALAFKDYLNPSKVGRPVNKPQRKQRVKKEKELKTGKISIQPAQPHYSSALQ